MSKYADGECDVYGKPRFTRMRSMRDNFPEYLKAVEEARKKAGRSPLDFSRVWPKKDVETPKVGTHSWVAALRKEEEEAIDESSLAEMYEEMEQLWASGPDPLTEAAQAA